MNIYILNNKKVKLAKNLPIFEIKSIKQKVNFELYDGLVFTSKNAVISINNIDKSWQKKPSYAIGLETAKVVEELDGNLKFVGQKKYGNEFALEIINNFQNQKLLYIRGSKVISNLVNILKKNSIECDEVIVYETICKKFDEKIVLPKNSTIIFSSPSTIKCFLENSNWDSSFKAVSIGSSTAKYFPPYIKPIVADTPSIESSIQKAIEINQKTKQNI